jgi:hypothetical protein
MAIKWGDGNVNISNVIGELRYTVAIGNYTGVQLTRIECHVGDLSDEIKSLELLNQNEDASIRELNGRYEFSYHIGETDIIFVKMDTKTDMVNIVYLVKE